MLCYTRIRESEKVISPDFSFDETKCAVHEVFKNSGDGLLLSILAMANSIKSSQVFPQNCSELWIKTLKKKK